MTLYELTLYSPRFLTRCTVAVLWSCILFACNGDDNNANSVRPTPAPVSQPITDIREASGLWDIGKRVFVRSFFEQGSGSSTTAAISELTWIDIDLDGNVSLIIQIRTLDSATNEFNECYLVQENFERWQQIEQNSFIANGTNTRQIRLRRAENALVIEEESRVEVFPRENPSTIDISRRCQIDGKELTLAPSNELGTEVFSLSEITGLWEKPLFTNIFETIENPVEAEFMQILEDGNTFTWRKIRNETCLLPVWRIKNVQIRENNDRFTFQLGDAFTRDTQLFEVFSSTLSSPSLIRNLLAIDPEGFRSTEVFVESNIELSDRASRCDLLRPDLTALGATQITSLADVSGIWQLRPLNVLDERYLRLSPDGEFVVYQFLADASNSGEGCYKEEERAVFNEIDNGIFTLRDDFLENTNIEIFLTAAQTLVLLSEQDSEGVYNRELTSTAPSAVNDLLPLCPSVRE